LIKWLKIRRKFKQEDEIQRQRVESRNHLENYAYSLKSSVKEEEVAKKLSEDDKKKISDIVDSTLSWLDTHTNVSKDEFENKQKELEQVAMPIMSKLAGASGMQNEFPTQGSSSGPRSASSGPIVDDLD